MTDKRYATPFAMLHAASLLSQRSRLEKFRQAIQRVVKDGDYVVDIGTGTGVLAIMAAKAGAGHVTAIDVNPESLLYARNAARMNEVDEVIDFFGGSFLEFVPDVKADVVICEMLSSMMLVEQQIPASFHATQKVLKSDGILLPQEVTVYVVPVECEEIWKRFQYEELQFPPVVQTTTQKITRDLADMAVLETFSLANLTEVTIVDQVLEFSIVEGGTLHGLVGVFESKLLDDIHLNMEDGWKQLFIPLPAPASVDKGDMFSVRLSYQPGVFDSLSIETF